MSFRVFFGKTEQPQWLLPTQSLLQCVDVIHEHIVSLDVQYFHVVLDTVSRQGSADNVANKLDFLHYNTLNNGAFYFSSIFFINIVYVYIINKSYYRYVENKTVDIVVFNTINKWYASVQVLHPADVVDTPVITTTTHCSDFVQLLYVAQLVCFMFERVNRNLVPGGKVLESGYKIKHYINKTSLESYLDAVRFDQN